VAEVEDLLQVERIGFTSDTPKKWSNGALPPMQKHAEAPKRSKSGVRY